MLRKMVIEYKKDFCVMIEIRRQLLLQGWIVLWTGEYKMCFGKSFGV